MDPFEMAVLIVLIITIGGVMKHRFQSKRWMSDVEQKTSDWMSDFEDDLGLYTDPQLRKRVDELEERVRTLERIATDRSQRLKEEIDGL